MRRSARHRIIALIAAVVCFLIVGLVTSPCVWDTEGRFSCYIFWTFHVGSNIPSFWDSFNQLQTSNPPLIKLLTTFGYALYAPLLLAGIGGLIYALKPTRYETRFCSTCSKETQQFRKETKFGPNRNVVEYVYMCEVCGGKNVEPVRENLLKKLLSDAQYEDAYKEWWVKMFPKEAYAREQFVNLTTDYVDLNHICLEKNEVKFSGAGSVVGKLYRKRQKEQSQVTQADFVSTIEKVATVESKTEQQKPQPSEVELKPTKYCRNCGAKIPRDSTYCEECGTNLSLNSVGP